MLKKIALSFVLLYTLLGFIVVPFLLKSQIINIVEQKTNTKVRIDNVSFNPFIFNLQLDGVKLAGYDNAPLVSFKSLQLDLELYSLLNSAVHVKSFIINEPKIFVVYNKDKSFNLGTLLKEDNSNDENQEKMQLPRVIVDVIKIDNGEVDYEDFTNSKKFDFSLRSIGFDVRDIDTNDFNASDAKLRFYSGLGDGGFVDFKTEILGFKPLKLKGSINFEASKLYTQWRYIQDRVGLEVADGKLSFGAEYHLNVDDFNSTSIENLHVSLQNLRIKPKNQTNDVLNLKYLHVDGVTILPMQKDVHVRSIALNSLDAKIKRDEKGEIDWIGYLKNPKENIAPEKVAATTETNTTNTNAIPWSVAIDKISLEKVSTTFDDKNLQNAAVTKIDNMNLNACDINSKSATWLNYQLSLRVNSGGYLKANGKLRHTPLKQEGTLELSRVSLKEFTPYIQESTYLKLNDGYLSLSSKVEYSKKATKADLDVHGKLKIEEFFLHDSRDDATIASFSLAELTSFDFKMFPNSLYIDEVNLDSFYIDALIDENKSMNLLKLLKVKNDENLIKNQDSEKTTSQKETAFPIKIMKFNVSNGSANFADYSLPIKFKTSIHDLNGNINAISNTKGEISYVEIDGIVDKYGSTKLKGSLDTSNVKAFTDIDFNFKNLGLDSLSGYSAKFAGYKIEKGKLFLDLGYKIHDSELLGKNSIIIKNIELGEAIEDENISKLPLGFAIALLEDSDGVIDINMPVEGNLDKPDFKYGALVWKTFVNLIVKAVASPFKFLGSVMGINTQDLDFVEFEAGEFKILPPQKEKLDSLVNILIKKPKLLLAITGSYNKVKDKEAIQVKKLTQEVLKRSDNKGVITVDLLEKIYIEAVGKDKANILKTQIKKMYKKEIFNTEYQQELQQRCTKLQSVTLDQLEELANKRSEIVQEYLVQTKNIQISRVLLSEVKEVDDEIKTVLNIEVK